MSGLFDALNAPVFALALAMGCARTAAPSRSTASDTAGRASPNDVGAPQRVLTLIAGAQTAPLPTDARWQQAAAGGEIELYRLAQAEGADGLLAQVPSGGDVALTALSALPYCPDAEARIGTLCSWIGVARPPAPLLEAIASIAAQPSRFGEALDAEGITSCRAALERAQRSSDWTLHERDLALSARAMLEERRAPR